MSISGLPLPAGKGPGLRSSMPFRFLRTLRPPGRDSTLKPHRWPYYPNCSPSLLEELLNSFSLYRLPASAWRRKHHGLSPGLRPQTRSQPERIAFSFPLSPPSRGLGSRDLKSGLLLGEGTSSIAREGGITFPPAPLRQSGTLLGHFGELPSRTGSSLGLR